MPSPQNTAETNARLAMHRMKHEERRKQRLEKLLKAVEKKDNQQ